MKKRSAVIIFLAILTLALGTRLIGLDRSFVLDEFRTIRFSRLPVDELLDVIKADAYPPLTFLALSLWMNIGQSDIWIRLLFIIFGALSVITVYAIGKEVMDYKFAFMAMFLMALMPMQVWISQYVRGITPGIFFILLATLFFLKLIKSNEWKEYNLNALGYIISSIMAIYSSYISFFVIFAQNIIYIFLNRNSIKNLLKWFLLQIALLVLFLPWLNGFLAQIGGRNVIKNFATMYNAGLNIYGIGIGLYMRCIAGLLGLDQVFLMNTAVAKNIPKFLMFPIALIFLVVTIFGIYLFVKICKKIIRENYPESAKFSLGKIIIFFSTFAILPLILFIISNILLKTPIRPRYFAVSSTFLIFIYALMLLSIKNKKVFYYILTIFIIISFVRLSDFSKTMIDYKNSAFFLENNIRDEECLLFIGADRAYEHYSGLPKNYIKSVDYIRNYTSGSDYSLEYLIDEKALKNRLEPFRVIWIYHSGEKMTGEVGYVQGLLESYGYKKENAFKFKNLEIFKYVKKT